MADECVRRVTQGDKAWQSCITSLAVEAADTISPSAMAAAGIRDPRHCVKVCQAKTFQLPAADLGPVLQVPTCMWVWVVKRG